MKKILSLILAVGLLACLFAGCGSDKNNDAATGSPAAGSPDSDPAASSKTLVMATNAEFPPYEYFESEQIVGIDAEIAQAICDKLGYELRIDNMEFGAIINAVTAGKADFSMAGMTITEDRLQSVDFSDPYANAVQVVIVREDSEITSADDLLADGATYVAGVQQDTTGDIYATDDMGDDRVQRYSKGADAVQALITGKIDCVIIDSEPAKNFVAANEGLKILNTEYANEDYAICFAKGSALTEEFNKALAELTADGTIQKIIDKYIPAE